MKKVITYILKILGWIVLGLIIILLLSALLLQTAFVKKKIATFAENQANNFITGQVRIGELNGNFFTNLSLDDLLISHNEDTVGYIEELSASYNLLPLIDGKLHLLNLKIASPPRIFLEQINDSTWNVQQLIKASDNEPESDTTTSNFAVKLDQFLLENGQVNIDSPPDTLFPHEINQIKLLLSGDYQANEQFLKLDELSFDTRQPAVSLEKLTFNLRRNQESLELNDFVLKTAKNQLQGEADYAEEPIRKGGNADLKVSQYS